ncbi:SRPBCC family protein [Microseira sp. BLCC-F43]|jgi:ribosome-associated toxin RatA of RatAB toxin-antitoxin module|uniref:SRPBCC family protein n=1 Tax=Microseira sp. BLCC-F43 TaxID=3153602 RepID=UPI0035BB7E12
MKVQSQASIEIKASPEQVFDFATAVSSLPKVFKGYGVIPAIRSAEIVGGGEMRSGVIRRVTNYDNSVIDEEIIKLTRPTKQTYKIVSGFKPPFSYLVRSGGGDWTLTPSNDSTIVTWKFYFEVTSVLAYPIVALIMSAQFQKAQQSCLAEIKKYVENVV